MKVWITKYALDKGIVFGNITDSELKRDEKYKIVCFGIENFDCMIEKHDIHKTKESAIARAEEMRRNKIESLKKQIRKLEEMTFE